MHMNELYQVEFKSLRKNYFVNGRNLNLGIGDAVIVEADNGEDLGIVSKNDAMIDPDARKKKREYKNIKRIVQEYDKRKLAENREREERALKDVVVRVDKHGLKMKLVEAEYQFDRAKLTFYFTAEKRVDFRALVKDLAADYKTRIELRQIGVRDEAKRVDGYGPCGRKLCCSGFLTQFNPITTQFAKTQHLPLNPSKLSGLCGRLKCCLAYENDFYEQAQKMFPKVEDRIEFPDQGVGVVRNIDILNNKVHLKFERTDEWQTMTLDEIANILNIDLSDVPGCGNKDGCGSCGTHDKKGKK